MKTLARLGLCVVLALAGVNPLVIAQVRLIGVDTTHLVEIDPATGATLSSIPLAGATGTVGAMAWDAATGTLFLSSTSFHNLWTLDPTTGQATLVGPYNITTSSFMHGLEVDDTGQLYGYSYVQMLGHPRFFSIDRTTGQATPIADPGTGGFGSLGFVSATGTMYLGDTAGDQLCTIDRATGATTVVGPYGAAAVLIGEQIGVSMAHHPALGMLAVNNWNSNSLWRLDLSTGAATFIGNLTTGNLIALAFVHIAPVTTGAPYCPGDGSVTACPCGNTSPAGTNVGCLSSLGNGGSLVASGTSSLANDTVVLAGSSMPSSSALYFQGTLQQSGGAGVLFGDGLRCVAGAITRLATTTNVAGSSQYPFGAAPAVHVKGNVTVPGTRTYQVWYRNAAAFCTPATFNLTNGWQLSWTP